MAKPGSLTRVTAERWIVPGQSLAAGDGWTIELPGLAVELVRLPVASNRAGKPFTLNAQVSLMCGCPITPGGLWDAGDYAVEALVYRQGRLMSRSPFSFVKAPGGYSGTAVVEAPGDYRLVIVARNQRTANKDPQTIEQLANQSQSIGDGNRADRRGGESPGRRS